jgi:predicted DNA-binding protein (UPF0251 family)
MGLSMDIIMSICSYVKAKVMVKTKKCRMVSALPGTTYYKPAGIPLRFLSEVRLSVDEAEALRLKDLEGLEQVEAAVKMGVSRPTFQRVLTAARKKVSDAILNGKAIRIEGGVFQLTGVEISCPRGHAWVKGAAAPGATSGICPECRERVGPGIEESPRKNEPDGKENHPSHS